ncbi:hypothetical protein KKB41_00450 [Patescibacteria group bacterium]|nr:hypothetical protein [Patescibacteria group bacterium]
MNKKSRQKLCAHITDLFRFYQDIAWCDHWIMETQDLELISALKMVKDIYAKDPDAVGHYHNAKEKLAKGQFRSELEREVLEAFRNAAGLILEEAEYKSQK